MFSPKSMTKLEALTVILELETCLLADPQQGGGGRLVSNFFRKRHVVLLSISLIFLRL